MAFPSFKSAPPPPPAKTPIAKPSKPGQSAPLKYADRNECISSSLHRRDRPEGRLDDEDAGLFLFDIDRKGDFEVFRYGRHHGEITDYDRSSTGILPAADARVNAYAKGERVDLRATANVPAVFVGPIANEVMLGDFVRIPSPEAIIPAEGNGDEPVHVVLDPLVQRQKELNELVAKDPRHEAAWIELVRLQPSLSSGSSAVAVLEKQAMILEKAMAHLPDSIDLLRIRLGEVESELQPFDAVLSAWRSAAAMRFSKSVAFWEAFVEWAMAPPLIASFQAELVLEILAEAMDAVDYSADPAVFSLFKRTVCFLHGAGFEEKAVAILRGFFDFNFGPAFDHATYPHALDTKQLDYLYCAQAEKDRADLLEGTWLELEAKQMARFWCPRGLDPSPLDPEEDFNREVVWEDISSFVYWSPHANMSEFFKLVFRIFGLVESAKDNEDVFSRPHEDVTWRLSKLVALPEFMLPTRDFPRLSPSQAEFILAMLMSVLPTVDDFSLAEAAFALYAQYHEDWRVRLQKVLSQNPGRAALWWAWCRLTGDVRAWRVLVERFVDRGLRARFALGAAQSLLQQGNMAALNELVVPVLASQPGDDGAADGDWRKLGEIGEYLSTGSVDPGKSPFALGLYQCRLFLHPEAQLDVPLYRNALLNHLQQAPSDVNLLAALSKLDPTPASFHSPPVRWINDHPSEGSLRLLLRLSLPHGNVNRVRALFERLLTLTNEPVLWERYLRYLHEHDSPAAVQALIYRALQRSPASKALYMTGIELVPSAREELYALAEEKGIRLRCLLEEATR